MSNEHTDLSVQGYVKGFIASLILTIIPFYFVATHSLPNDITYVILFGCAIIQVIVHFYYFLHLESKSHDGRWSIISLVFTAVVVLILIGGSIWIMWNLNENMMM
ncbi:cytochrome o ubiquinol oxidase subunit IV [Vibrio sp. S4M6]|uniref:cytochrome o ubiquinol oxidase subunit IV n=1 Tax=Vibrio sinus TaxID=2946865 RepID=UPI00202A6385|nr:cytochrome o ubiquinol oxidase subunit IV [Vibrio sinus]MCL9782438.1 cytochrome o ubiquinol oxidase subunit IV [Vibrio sinus]